ncbi:MAG TPA: MFS transporter [Polyangia bacterium]|nr:MFS transporter [Polyangia bacterium]
MNDKAQRIIRTYLTLTGLFNSALALIWGVNTLFLLKAGLDIFHVMLVNAAFSFAEFFFEVPTGVVADTLGRRISLLFCLITLLGSTLAYVALPAVGLGFWSFVLVSVALGLGFTFWSGAAEAWLVDALKHVGYDQPIEDVFAKSQVAYGVAMLVGTTVGGLLGQLDLRVPYVVRAALLVPIIWIAWTRIEELGYEKRALHLATLPAEMKAIFVGGVKHGLRHPVVRPLIFAAAVANTFMMFGFYSWQRYFLDLLGKEAVWVNGVVAALVGAASIAGNLVMSRVTNFIRTRSGVLIASVAVRAVTIVLAGMATSFSAAVGLYLISNFVGGIASPIRQGLINHHIPSSQRATILSVDSLFSELGSGVGQSGWGYLARKQGIGRAWVAAGAFLILGIPLLALARRADPESDRFGAPATAAPAVDA